MSADTTRREYVPIAREDAPLVDALLDSTSAEHAALVELVGPLASNASKASVLRATLHAGIERVRESALDAEYREMAADMGASDRNENAALADIALEEHLANGREG